MIVLNKRYSAGEALFEGLPDEKALPCEMRKTHRDFLGGGGEGEATGKEKNFSWRGPLQRFAERLKRGGPFFRGTPKRVESSTGEDAGGGEKKRRSRKNPESLEKSGGSF